MSINLYDHQLKALKKMKNGCILCGGVGSGKSRTSLAYYFLRNGGSIEPYIPMDDSPKDLYIITTARKRDTKEWEGDMAPFLISTDSKTNIYNHKVTVDSWNNIGKYKDIEDAFFIFDEQRVVGYGAWTKAFLKIAKFNEWILLSATPGDTWMDYIPVFIANGFYKNKTEFQREHVIFSRYSKFPKVDRYVNTGRLIRLRNNILIDMKYYKPAEPIHIDIFTDYNIPLYKAVMKNRWSYSKEEPIASASELCMELRKVVNSDRTRLESVINILKDKKKAIIFYNFDYELELLMDFLDDNGYTYTQWNGHKHQPVPDKDEKGNEIKEWAYLVQYTAGAEGWNCIKTDTIIFYSQNYSYKVMVQSAGRIDRLNTPFKQLYYYHLKSRSGIDLAISKALKNKKNFNEGKFASS